MPRISLLDPAGPVTGAEEIAVVQGGDTKRVSLDALLDARMGGALISILQTGAVGGDVGDQTAAIQAAVDAVIAAGGGTVLIPPDTFRHLGTVHVTGSNVKFLGLGPRSKLHFVDATRANAIVADGTSLAPLFGVVFDDFTIEGDAVYTNWAPDITNGGAIIANFANNSAARNLVVRGFSDGGVFFINSSNSRILDCDVSEVAQGLGFLANAINCSGNAIIGNNVTDIRTFNGIHLEGSFGDALGDGQIFDTTITGNVVDHTYEAGINIELAPGTTCIGNTVSEAGYGSFLGTWQAGPGIDMGIKTFGSPRCAIGHNVIVDSFGYAIVHGAGGSRSTIIGNVTSGNDGGSLLVTDSGVSANEENIIEPNSFAEGPPVFSGNATAAIQRTFSNRPDFRAFRRSAGQQLVTLYEGEGGDIIWRKGLGIDGGLDGIEYQWWREGVNVVALALNGSGHVKPNLPTHADNAAAVAAGMELKALYRTATGEVRVVV